MFLNKISKAPEFPKNFRWLNTDRPLSLEKLKGHVIILDFWTYCCINCMHILPDLEHIEEKYKKQPVVVIGVHSAKFEQEADPKNIWQAILRYEIKHPVIVDKEMRMWNEYQATGWPTLAVIDTKGNIIFKTSGEGHRDEIIELVDTILEDQKNILAKKKIEIKIPENKNKPTLSYPGKLSFSPGKKYFALSNSNRNKILVVDLKGKVVEEAGSGKKGMKDGNFSDAEFNRPQGVLFLENKIFVADTENHCIRLIDLKNKKVKTVAGTGKQAYWGSAGGKGEETDLSSPWDLAGRNGMIYIAMAGAHQLWVFDPKSDFIRPFAGDGREDIIDGTLSDSSFAQPSGLAVLDGNIFMADSEVSGIRKIDIKNNFVSTVSGKGLFEFGFKDGPAKQALFQHPLGICAGGKNVLYVADTYNNAIRKIDLEKMEVSTVIKKIEANVCMIGDEECKVLGLWEPSDVKYLDGKLYITDTNNHLVRIFDFEKNKLENLDIK